MSELAQALPNDSEAMGLAAASQHVQVQASTRPTYALMLGDGPLKIWNGDYREGLFSEVGKGDELTLLCSDTRREEGDSVYLIRLAEQPHGIVAKGTITRSVQINSEKADLATPRNRVGVRIDELRASCADGLLPLVLLNMALPGENWSQQVSGRPIDQAIVPALDRLWQVGQHKHSLRQYIEWSSADKRESCPGWLADYRAITQLADSLSKGATNLERPALERLWLERENGVSSLKLGLLSRSEFDSQFEQLAEITRSIMKDATPDHFKQIAKRWMAGVRAGDFSMNRPAMISRVFAAFSPERYTSLLKVDDCQFLLGKLNAQFQLPQVVVAEQGWCELNAQLKGCVEASGTPQAAVLENNIALWQLLKAFKETKAVQGDEDMQGDPGVKGLDIPLNQILFGPPGTGKTYATIDHALQILDPGLLAENSGDDDETRRLLKARFDELIEEKRIRFVTFHQSLSYEDFIEGLKASSENGQIRYHPEDGIFKAICTDARAVTGLPSLDEQLSQFVEQAAESPVVLETTRGKRFSVVYRDGNTTLTCRPEAAVTELTLPANIDHVRQLLHGVRAQNIYCESYVRGIADHIKAEFSKLQGPAQGDVTRKPYVLIIDEINRGNVSRIFGELITLIEPSKRQGAGECLPVVLPYSREPFTVPDNLYIIGTMNTADRSLAGLDVALRRRFTFQEMSPRPQLLGEVQVQGVNIGELLQTLNQRIEVLLGRDHCLGHAYFMPLKQDNSLTRLKTIFRNQILPLLQEYFFEDWQRIQWVFNDHRKPQGDRFVQQGVPDMAELFGTLNVPAQGSVWRINDSAFERIAAYKGIIVADTEGKVPVEALEEAGA
ncbi:McrB family protein [Pseudomonas sichuanensis]|uniref:McrB family protein n=1 Tax=Pseudomonas sichuanensis TaxID=2213015 RepID=UPI00216023AF|nr:AAA family ATPase [Pseudomonas sichuanensis]UVL90013.1 AAA family ATPase [Pseudomonas sichuanensis]